MPALSERRKGRLARRQRPGVVTAVEAVAVVLVIAAVIAMIVWFFFFAHRGIGPGAL